eukprot:gene11317-1375_t
MESWAGINRYADAPAKPDWFRLSLSETTEYIWCWMTTYVLFGRRGEMASLRFKDLLVESGTVWRVRLHGANPDDGFATKGAADGAAQYAMLSRFIWGLPHSTTLWGRTPPIMTEREELERPILMARFLFHAVYHSLVIVHGKQELSASMTRANSVASFLRTYRQQFDHLPMFPNFNAEVSNRISKHVAGRNRWPHMNLEDPPRELQYVMHGLRSAPATVAIGLFGFEVERVMCWGHWESPVVADYVQHLHPELAALSMRVGQLQRRVDHPVLLEGVGRRYVPEDDRAVEPEPAFAKASATAAVRRSLAAARAQRERDALECLQGT